MKTGIKLVLNLFEQEKSDSTKKILDDFGSLDALIGYCSENLDGAEISAVRINTDPDFVFDTVISLENAGLHITIHGTLNPDITGEMFFAPYKKLLESGKLSHTLNITVHPLKTEDETTDILRGIVEYIDSVGYNVRITLENQRNKSEATVFAGCMGVKRIVKKINHPRLRLCFDFGHRMSNIKKEMQPFDAIDDEFFSLTSHTHIHSYFEGRTHFPLNFGETALCENISTLKKYGYDEMYLLELMPERYPDDIPIKDSYTESIRILNDAIEK